MTVKGARVSVLAAAGLIGLHGVLAGCSTSTQVADAAPTASSPAGTAADPDTTGSIAGPARPASPSPQQPPPEQTPPPQQSPLMNAILPFLLTTPGQ